MTLIAITIKPREGVNIWSLHKDVVIADKAAALTALHNKAVVVDRIVCVLLSKGWIDVRILFHHCNMVGEAVIFAQQVFDDLVLLAVLHHPIDGHILIQGIDGSLIRWEEQEQRNERIFAARRK